MRKAMALHRTAGSETADQDSRSPKRATNVSLNGRLLSEARALGINISRACDRGLAMQIAEERARRWLDENKAALESSNAFVERHGVPLARYRKF
jgi:antitoxin CcdA